MCVTFGSESDGPGNALSSFRVTFHCGRGICSRLVLELLNADLRVLEHVLT